MNGLKSLSARRVSLFKHMGRHAAAAATPARPIATTPAAAAPAATTASASAVFLDQIKNRRTYYPLSKDLTISAERVQEIVKEALLHVPSSFNSQTTRVVVLLGAEHEKLWDITTDVLRGIVPTNKWELTGNKMAMFKGAAGTIMFFEDQDVVKSMQANFAAYSDKFPIWATQSDAMLQFALWTALEAEGLGANLQHYNPIIDERVAAAWDLPASWKLNAQLVFGGTTGEAGEKEFMPLELRYKAFGA